MLLALPKVHVPAAVFVTDVALLASLAINSPNDPPPVPVNVNVRVPVPLVAILLVSVKVKVAEPEASIVPPLVPIVNNRFVLLFALPVYFNVPPLITKLAASLVDAPMLLLDPPSAKVDTLKVPALMVVTPV